MAFEAHASEAFGDDLFDILNYFIVQLGAPQAAANFIADVDAAKEILEEALYINGLSLRYGLGEAGVREHLVRNYSIVYRVDGARVVLLRLLHQSQLADRLVIDWEN